MVRNFRRRWRGISVVGVVGKCAQAIYVKRHVTPSRELAPVQLKDLIEPLQRAGIGAGATVLMHSSWAGMKADGFSPSDLISALLDVLGPTGTLCMPAMPTLGPQDGDYFNFDRAPSMAGLVSETFRRFTGVVRSVNANHSVCALGPNAKYLVERHHLSTTSWDQYSPYYRIRNIDNSWVVGLGVGRGLGVATSLHCVESALSEHPFFTKLFLRPICYRYESNALGGGLHCYRPRWGAIYPPRLAKYFNGEQLRETTVKGVDVYAIRARTLIDTSIALGEQGITMYVFPIPFRRFFG